MKNRYEVSQTEPGVFLLTRSGTDEVQIYLKKDNGDHTHLLTTDEKEVSLKLETDGKRPYFLIKSEDGEYTTAERTLPVEGMNNFRDMGGYLTDDGKRVKWGMLYRSDHIYNATEKGLEYVNGLGLHTIIDYRSDNEIAKYPNPEVSGDAKTYQLDPSAHTAELSAQFSSSKKDEDLNLVNKVIEQKENNALTDHAAVIIEQYRTFANKEPSKEAFSKMLKLAADPSAPAFLQHCRGGKDRTGFGAMLLLGILGVSKEDLVEDYMLTEENRLERNEYKMAQYRKLTSDQVVLDQLFSFIDTRSEFLEASIDTIVEAYGSIEDYVVRELNVTEEEISSMKKMYLV
ncbi:tyrosine-protein phosphatase [Corticicoccus populi]|uniref:Tyrosine-protein phosphatase n=1 Tax=Corticicoccus populi TaxID=1812821 RepID=A0ABW5X054_9STAP